MRMSRTASAFTRDLARLRATRGKLPLFGGLACLPLA